MAEPFAGLSAALIEANLARVRAQIPEGTRVLCATKYVTSADMPILAEAGIDLVGENRLQDLEEKQAEHGGLFEWHFIGALQSRKAARVAEKVALIHSLASESALRRLEDAPGAVLVQVNVAGESGKEGIDPAQLTDFIERCPVPVRGLSTMPPAADNPESSRPHFAMLARLAGEHGLEELSMGTSQDWKVAVEEGATMIRLGTALLR